MKHSYLSGFIFFIALILVGTTSAGAYENEINSLSATIGGKIATTGKNLVAVTDFVDLQGSVTELGRFLAEEFSTAIAGSGKGFEVVDRANLKVILAEHKLSATGIIDPATARKLGQVAGVQALITGTITPFGDSVRLSVKVLDTETAKVISAANVNIARTKAIEELLARGIDTGQAASSPTSGSNYVSSASSQKSKKIGNLIITIKRLEVLKGSIKLTLDIFNQSDKDLGIGMGWNMSPTLTDEKGNVYISNRLGSTLISKSNNDFVLCLSGKPA